MDAANSFAKQRNEEELTQLIDLRVNTKIYETRKMVSLLLWIIVMSFADLSASDRSKIFFPPEVANPEWIESRRDRQLNTRSRFKVNADFTLTDQLVKSQITFANISTEDTGKRYKASHYDHGNGIAVADVDGDGRYDLYFSTMAGSNELWKNAGAGKFEVITADDLALANAIGVSASFADVDNDGDPDLFATTLRGGNYLFENNGSGRVVNITQKSGLTYSGHSSSGVFFDYDRDGQLDLYVANVGKFTTDTVITAPQNALDPKEEVFYQYYEAYPDAFAGHLKPDRYEPSMLYRNSEGMSFEDVTKEVGLVDSSWSGAATPIDANDDGWPDLYVLDMQGHDEYFENRKGEAFTRKSRDVFPRTPWGSMGVKVFDYDNDGKLDLYVSDMHSDMSSDIGPWDEKWKANMQFPESFLNSGGMSVFGNALYRKIGSDSYQEVSDAVGAENYWPWGLSVGDLNADGFEDVFLSSSMNYPFRYGINTVLLNNAGLEFLDSEYLLGVEPREGGVTSKAWFYLECGGRDEQHQHCEGQDGDIEVWASVGTRSSVIFDFDDDGDLDIITNEFNAQPMVLVNDFSERHLIRYLKLKLVGSRSNRDGLGARVTVIAGNAQYTKIYDGQSGYLSQSVIPLYFGLGDATSVDRVDVVWPSGKRQSIEGINSNQLYVVKEK